MKFTPKKTTLQEEAINPLTNIVEDDKDTTKLVQQAILSAIASETDAINEYNQIIDGLKSSEEWLVKAVKPTLEDVVKEEEKHLGQLTKLASDFPKMKENFIKGWEEAETGEDVDVKESINEAVSENRRYTPEDIVEVICNKYNMTEKDEDWTETCFKMYSGVDELYPEEVNLGLHEFAEHFQLSEEDLRELEQEIMQKTVDPIEKRKEEFKSDIETDISTLENLFEHLYTIAANDKIQEVIDYLKNLQYNGENKEAVWGMYQLDKKGTPNDKIIR